jgi:hypothetical protein
MPVLRFRRTPTKLLTQQSLFIASSSPRSEFLLAMSAYSPTVLAHPGVAPEDAKAHHLRDKHGQLVRFQNPFRSYGHWRDHAFLRGLYNFLRYVCPAFLVSFRVTLHQLS